MSSNSAVLVGPDVGLQSMWRVSVSLVSKTQTNRIGDAHLFDGAIGDNVGATVGDLDG